MSERDALRFIEKVNSDLELQCKLRALDPTGDLQRVAELATEAGFDFDVEELRHAFLTDWGMRRRFYAAVRK